MKYIADYQRFKAVPGPFSFIESLHTHNEIVAMVSLLNRNFAY